MKYLALEEELDYEGFVVCTYRVETSLSLEDAANRLAAEESTGTWTDVTTETEQIFSRYGAKVTEISKLDSEKGTNKGMITIAYPIDDFSIEVGGIPQILSIVAGNLFGLESLTNVRLEDVRFPKAITQGFKGPKFGIDGVREILGHPKGRPLIGTIVKPKIGLNPKDFANYIYEGGMGGLTNSKDDETLVNQKFCPLEDRVSEVADAVDRVRQETGKNMLHAINISTRVDQIVEIGEKAIELGANQLMIDILTSGFTAVQALAEAPSIKVPIHVHRTMHGAITRNTEHGISMTVIAKLARLAGGDAIHIGTFGVGKMHGKSEEDKLYQRAITERNEPLKPMIPVCSGGMHPGLVKPLIDAAGPNIQIQAGGGISGHPLGVRAGAKAMVQAVDAALREISAEEYSKYHKELRIALEKWCGE